MNCPTALVSSSDGARAVAEAVKSHRSEELQAEARFRRLAR